MELTKEILLETPYTLSHAWRLMDGERSVSHGSSNLLDSRYCGSWLRTLTIGGIGTPPEERRRGHVRQILNAMMEHGIENGAAVAMLHPFSFAYYRMFGFEKISDHKTMEFPMSAIACFPRYKNIVPVKDESRLPDLLKVYDAFSANRNIMFRRFDGTRFPFGDKSRLMYLYYSAAGEPIAYSVLQVENHLEVNRMVSDNLHVYEMAFTCPEGLLAVIGSLRMFEGQLESVFIHDWAMIPELDGALRNYNHTRYRQISDIAARILNVPKLLEANAYPEAAGHFTVRVEDTLESTRGVYEVEYAGGKGAARKLADTASADVTAAMPAFTAMVYAYQHYTAESAAYLPGVKVENPESDFFRAFTQRPTGLFEHF